MPRGRSCSWPAAPTASGVSAGLPASKPSKPVSRIRWGRLHERRLPLSRLRRRRRHPRLRGLPRLLPGQALPRGLPPVPALLPPPAAPASDRRRRLLRALSDPREEVAPLRRAQVAGDGRALLRRARASSRDADRGLRVRGWGVSGDVEREGLRLDRL